MAALAADRRRLLKYMDFLDQADLEREGEILAIRPPAVIVPLSRRVTGEPINTGSLSC